MDGQEITNEEIEELFIAELAGSDKSITSVRYEHELEVSERKVQKILQVAGFWVCNKCYAWAQLENGRCQECNQKKLPDVVRKRSGC